MPLFDYKCSVCGHVSEHLLYGYIPEFQVCEKCFNQADRMMPVIAKPETIHHMGDQRCPHSGIMYSKNSELRKEYEKQGLIHSSDISNSISFIEDMQHEQLEEAKVVKKLDAVDIANPDMEKVDKILKDSPRFQKILKKTEGSVDRALQKTYDEGIV